MNYSALYNKKGDKIGELYWRNGIVIGGASSLNNKGYQWMHGWDEEAVTNWCNSVGWQHCDY